jgi:hypothetical protein
MNFGARAGGLTVDQERDLGSKAERKAIAGQIQRYLDKHGMSRKDLIRDYLSQSSIEKLFQGDFTDRTLNKVEGILATTFQRGAVRAPVEIRTAAKTVGGYMFDAVKHLQGDYLCVRPVFANPANINAYLVSIVWSDDQKGLVFEERKRFDAKYSHRGSVYIAFGTSFLNLVSASEGNVRTVLLSLPDSDGVLRGIINALSNPKGSIFIPASAPIVLRKLREGEEPDLGIISGKSGSYHPYQSLLATVLAEDFGIFAIPRYSGDQPSDEGLVSQAAHGRLPSV